MADKESNLKFRRRHVNIRDTRSGAVGRLVVGLLFPLLFVAPCRAIAAGADLHIRHIESDILPPVLVKGEARPHTSLSERMRALHVPGVSIAFVHIGRIEWARGFGVVRVGGPPVTPDTLFQAASISKSVAALAVLHLAQTGKLNLDTDVNVYLKTWKVPDSPLTAHAKVTLRGLLTHSAGITVHGFPGYEAGSPLPTLQQVLDGSPPANSPPIRVDKIPGLSWRYSGGGYLIAQQVLFDVTGTPFPTLMRKLVLDPIGMSHSTYEQPLPSKLLARAATPYRDDGSPVKGGPHVYPELAAAGLWTTPSDLARFIIAVQRAYSGASERVISMATSHAMLTREFDDDGLGLFVGGSAKHRYFTHSGANEGYRCDLLAYDSGDGIVVMTNSDNGGELASEIVHTVAHEYGWPDFAPSERTLGKLNPSAFDQEAGAYRLPSGDIMTFWREGTGLRVQQWGFGIGELYPSSDREYFLKFPDLRIVFSPPVAGASPTATIYQNDGTVVIHRVTGAAAAAALQLSRETEKRVRNQSRAPGTEAALRRLIAGLASGKPAYKELAPGLAALTRQELPTLQRIMSQLGAIQSITFKGVGVAGADIYDVTYAHGECQWRILLNPDGSIYRAGFTGP